jgi:hypothetical protein
VTGAISSTKALVRDRGLRAAQRSDRVAIPRFAGQLVFVGGILRERAHRTAGS